MIARAGIHPFLWNGFKYHNTGGCGPSDPAGNPAHDPITPDNPT